MSDTVTEAAAEQKTDEVKTYSEEQFKGLLADKQSEVKKRQSIETELAELKAGQVQSPAARETADDGEDAPMTVSQFRKMLAEERQTDSDARFALLEKETISEVKQNLTAEAKGELAKVIIPMVSIKTNRAKSVVIDFFFKTCSIL